MDIIMIRHGESQDNVEKIFSRDSTRLTDRGIGQILQARELLKNFDYQRVYYSPLVRTVETLMHLGLEGEEENRIREINFGIFTGRTFREISEVYPKESQAWVEDSQAYAIPEGESLLHVYERLGDFLQDLIKRDENVLLVTHDCVIRLAFCWVLDNPDHFFRFKVDNGSINVISLEDKYKFIKKMNYI